MEALPANILNALLACLNGDNAEAWLSSIHKNAPAFLKCSTDVLFFYEIIARESSEKLEQLPYLLASHFKWWVLWSTVM